MLAFAMPSRPLLTLAGPVLLALPCALLCAAGGCTSDLPAPSNFTVLEPPPPDNELVVDCAMLPLTAEGAEYEQTPTIMGQLEDVIYRYTAVDLPAGLVIDEKTGLISGTVAAMRGDYVFDVTIEDVDDPENYNATGTCNLHVNERLSTPLDIDTVPYCLRAGDDLRDLVVAGTGDGTPITCDHTSGNGNGRKPNGIEVSADTCTLTGAIAEDRYGTWVFMMRGTQSGAQVFVPYCVTNDEPQGYTITARHSGNDDAALLPIARTYDPTTDFSVGADMDPRYEVTAPGICGSSCFYKYEFLRTNAPIGEMGGFSLDPDGLLQDAAMESLGFFHELRVSGPRVPEEFLLRPWVLSVSVSYCISDSDTGCVDASEDGDAALELALIMVPDRG
jgi:Putative Ig domain